MSNNGAFGRYRDNVSRDADDIAGFFSTRAGVIVAGAMVAAVIIGGIVGLVTGWIS